MHCHGKSSLSGKLSHGGIPWMKFHWKLPMATNKEQRGNKPHQPVAELKSGNLMAYGSQKHIPNLPEGRGPRSLEAGS